VHAEKQKFSTHPWKSFADINETSEKDTAATGFAVYGS
jgi:hypothetical protein